LVILKKDIDKELEQYPNFRKELFDKLYSFFSRYFTESGSIYFNSTPFHNNIYEKVYTDDRDVILFWKTRMLYYVKTDKIFRSLDIEIDELNFYFDVSNLEHKKANEKRDLIYEFKEIKDDKTIVFNVYYSEKGRKTKTEEILKELKKKNIKIDEEIIEKAFRVFEKQSEVDFFINKNAKEFLQEQFKLWSYQYFWEGAKEWSSDRVNQLQILKDISFKIIDFISQFEDELVKIWNKPKFVKNSNYVITLDRIKDLKIIEKIIKHKNIDEQIKEWRELGIVDDSFKTKEVIESDLAGKHLNKKYEHLPIDTKYFKDLELEILDLFDDLDQSLDGWLIKSENYQALNTILPKFKEKVQTIYIDPPFNLDSSDQFLYRTNYKDANWATLLENRLRIAKEWLNEKGSIFIRCDYNGNWIVRCLMDEIFGNLLNEIQVSRISKKGFNANRYPSANDHIYVYSINENPFFNVLRIDKKNGKEKWHSMDSMSGGRGTGKPRIILGELRYPPKNRVWTFSQERIYEMEKQGLIKLNSKGKPIYKVLAQDGEPLDSNWTDIPGYSSTTEFAIENSEKLLDRVIRTGSDKCDLVMDFFLGSGTTTAVAHKLGRKWIGVEMGEHFYTVVLPRMKKVLAYDKSGISKEVKEYQGGGFFKYYELEQYEETLANTVYEDSDLLDSGNKSPYEQYVFLKDEKMLKVLEIDYKNKKVKIDLDKLYKNIDIAETISNLTGKWIKKIKKDEIEFEDGTKINPNNLDYKLIKPLIWWE
jgi:adenine-specific DNA-methyltransferase